MPIKTLSTSAEELLPESGLRQSFIVQNEDTAINVFVKKERPGGTTVSSTNHDHRISPGSHLSLEVDRDGVEATQARWTIIAASGTPIISVFETERVRR